MTNVVTLFPPLDKRLQLGTHSWTPGMVSQAVRTGVEVASHRRAAALFSELTQASLSKSSLQRLCTQYGTALDEARSEEAEAMVRVPQREDEVEAVRWRAVPEPESPVMNVSSDGVMIHLVDEGWKEVKTSVVSAVKTTLDEETGEVDVQLSHHSYRAGLWSAKEFGHQLWAESCRRGLEKAKRVTSVNDGARWIWAIVWMCFAHCIQILDWWHAVPYLWTIADAAFGEDRAAAQAWVAAQKGHLAQSNLRQVMRDVRARFPRGQPLPEPVRASVAYLFHNRWRMCYREFRAAGCPIGSGNVESGCKLVVQQRMKQAGMRWSRDGAQAMLALRSALLSDQWQTVDAAICPP